MRNTTDVQINEVARLAVENGVAVVTINSPPVNALSASVRQGIAAAFAKASADPEVTAIVLICDGRTFFAGADIAELGKPPIEPTLRKLLERLEGSQKPLIAVIHGTALGGGLELALVAHYRVAVPSAKCGLPEVKLGLLPGAGGTQRLPRIVGVQKALEMITSGKHVRAPEALEMGLIDELLEEGRLREDAVAFALRVADERRPLRKVRELSAALESARTDPSVFDSFREVNARRFRGLHAPERIIRCIEAAVNLPFEEGMRFERRMVEELMADSQSIAQRHYFFAERQAAKVDDVPPDTPTLSISRVGLVGGGAMASGIATSCLRHGIHVVFIESTPEALERGIGVIRSHCEVSLRQVGAGSAEVDTVTGLLRGSLDMADLGECDLVIENIAEQMDLKRALFSRLDRVVRADTLLATHTASLSLDEIASSTTRPQDVLGLHFFPPGNLGRLLEIARGEKTGRMAIATALRLARAVGKVGVVVRAGEGTVGRRMLAQLQREAGKLILEGAWPWDVDRVLCDFGFAMGPFQLCDLVDEGLGGHRATDPPATVPKMLKSLGRRGRETGAGYYDYDEKGEGTPSPLVEQVIIDLCRSCGIKRRHIEDREIIERCLYSLVNEGANILLERKVARASDIDVIWVAGYGWPVYRGGPMFWAGVEGLAHIRERLRELQARHGEDFRPSALLERLAAEGRGFHD